MEGGVNDKERVQRVTVRGELVYRSETSEPRLCYNRRQLNFLYS